MEADQDNFRAALEWTLDENDGPAALRLCGALFGFWQLRGHLAEGRRSLAQALALPGEQPERLRGWALFAASHLSTQMGDARAARPFGGEALEIFRRLGDEARVAMALNELAAIGQFSDDVVSYRALATESLAMARRLALKPWIVMAAQHASTAAMWGGDFAAKDLLDEAEAVARELGGAALLGSALWSQALWSTYQGDWGTALHYLDEAVALSRRSGSPIALVQILPLRAVTLSRLGDRQAARATAEEAVDTARRTGSHVAESVSLALLGELALGEGDRRQAQVRYTEALKVIPASHSVVGFGSLLYVGLAQLALAEERPDLSARLLVAVETEASRRGVTFVPSVADAIDVPRQASKSGLTEAAWRAVVAEGRTVTVDHAAADILALAT